jgi:hypothetical protein
LSPAGQRAIVVTCTLDYELLLQKPEQLAKCKALFLSISKEMQVLYAAAMVIRGVIREKRTIWYDGEVEDVGLSKKPNVPTGLPPLAWMVWHGAASAARLPSRLKAACTEQDKGELFFAGGPKPMNTDELAATYPSLVALASPPGIIARPNEPQVPRAAYARAAEGLLAELDDAGFRVTALDELRVQGINRHNVRILTRWLPKTDYMPLHSDIVHCLHRGKSRSALGTLVAEFEREKDRNRWELGGAIAAIANKNDYDLLERLVIPKRYGMARQMLVMKLWVYRDEPRACPLLISLLDDDGVALHALRALGKLGNRDALPNVRRFLDSEFLSIFTAGGVSPSGAASGLRKEARRAVARLDISRP